MLAAQRNDHRAGQRRQIDDRPGPVVALNPGERIAQHQPPLGIGVEDFDGLARHRRDDIAGALGIAVGHVFHQPAHADDVRPRLAQRERLHRACDRTGAAHVPLHVFHARARLQGNAAGVEGHALADQRQIGVASALALPFHHQQLGIAHRTLADAEQRPHAERGHLRLAQHLQLQPQPFDIGPHAGDEAFGVDHVGRLRHQRAGERDAACHRCLMRPGRLRPVGRARQRDFGERGLLLLGQLRAIGVDPPAAQRGRDGKARHCRGRRRPGQCGPVHRHAGRAGGQQACGECAARAFIIGFAAGAHAQQQQLDHAAAMADERFRDAARLPFKPRRARGRQRQRLRRHVEAAKDEPFKPVLFDRQGQDRGGIGNDGGKANVHVQALL